jgi:mannose-1-phosphate guanylyltransferase
MRSPEIDERYETQLPDRPWALVLAGGDGRRLQALTQKIAGAPIPKQYCRITGDRSMLEWTLARIAPLVPRERTLVVVNRDHLSLAQPQLSDFPFVNVVVQAENRDTGPGILLGLLHLAARRPRTPVVVFPSDHYIDDEEVFRRHVNRAIAVADRLPGTIALLGARSLRPEPSLGYIEPGQRLRIPGIDDGEAYRVAAFHEKPSPCLAAKLHNNGGLCNTFIMTFRVGTVLRLLRDRLPAEVDAMMHAVVSEGVGYQGVRSWNFSTDFLTRIPDKLAVVPLEGVSWSDWGTPEAVEQTLAQVRRTAAASDWRQLQ